MKPHTGRLVSGGRIQEMGRRNSYPNTPTTEIPVPRYSQYTPWWGSQDALASSTGCWKLYSSVPLAWYQEAAPPCLPQNKRDGVTHPTLSTLNTRYKSVCLQMESILKDDFTGQKCRHLSRRPHLWQLTSPDLYWPLPNLQWEGNQPSYRPQSLLL